ncbi:cbb3-type cytochrome oxidase subunit 3 [Undibacterium sp.]
MNFTILSSVMTVISLIAFIGILYWAFSSKNKARFEEMAKLPLDNENGK